MWRNKQILLIGSIICFAQTIIFAYFFKSPDTAQMNATAAIVLVWMWGAA